MRLGFSTGSLLLRVSFEVLLLGLSFLKSLGAFLAAERVLFSVDCRMMRRKFACFRCDF